MAVAGSNSGSAKDEFCTRVEACKPNLQLSIVLRQWPREDVPNQLLMLDLLLTMRG